MLIGLPAAGKTTFYRRYFAATHRHISKDLWPNARHKERRQQAALAEAFAAGHSVVVDNTNPTAAERARIITIARASGARVVGYFLDVPTRESVGRNAGREDRARVPNVAIFTTAKRLQPPTLAEGFDQLFRLTLAADRTMTIGEITAGSSPQSREEP